MMATVDTTYFVVCWKYFLGIFIVVVTTAASAKEKKIQLTQTKKQLLTGSIWLTAKQRQLQQQSLKTWKRGTKTTGTNISTTVTKMGKKCKPSECEHDSSRQCKGLVRNPMLYLIELDFSKLENHLKSWLLNIHHVEDPDNQKVEEKLNKYRDNPRELIFEIALSRDDKDAKALEKIRGRLNEKIKNVCIVANNVTKKRCEFSNSENLLLHSLFQLHKNHKVQLIYNVR